MILKTVKYNYYKKFYGELYSPIFDEDVNYYQKALSLKEQYRLSMEIDDVVGWKHKPNQMFNTNRKITERSTQLHKYDEEPITVDFFSGSTGWGWGVFDKENMIASVLSENLKKSMENHSQVAFDIYKILRQIQDKKLNNNLRDKVIIYLGVNESYFHSMQKNLTESPRIVRIKKNLKFFEKYYYSHSLPLVRLIIDQFRLSFRRIKIIFTKRKAYKKTTKDSKYWNDELFFYQLKNILKHIKETTNDLVIYLEPTLFHKNIYSRYEQELIDNYDISNPQLRISIFKVYKYIKNFCEEMNINYIDLSYIVKNNQDDLFWDYCHPSEQLAKLLKTKMRLDHDKL